MSKEKHTFYVKVTGEKDEDVLKFGNRFDPACWSVKELIKLPKAPIQLHPGATHVP